MTADEFFRWQPQDGRSYELRNGVPVAMATPKPGHQILAGRLARFLDEALDDRPPCTLRIEAPIAVPDRDDMIHQADLAVTCAEHQSGQKSTPEPLIVVEILSPSTEKYDRRVKLGDYRSIPSVQEVVLIAQDQVYCEVHRRVDGERWQTDLLRLDEARLRLQSIGFDQPLEKIYRRIAIPKDSV